MNCLECQHLVQQQLDGEPAGAGELDRHLADCAACRQLFAAARCLEEGLRRLPQPVPPVGFCNRLVGAALADRRRRQIGRRRMVVIGSLAAAVVVAVLASSVWRPTPQPAAPVVVQAPPSVPTPPVPSLQDSVAELGSAVAALARRTTAETVEPTRLLWPESPKEEPREDSAELAAQTLWEAGQGASAGLEPVTSSARRAVDLFLRELPPMSGGPIPN